MLILCSLLSSAALAGEITVHLETHEAGPAAVTFHDVQDGDTLHVLLPGEDGQPVGWFETRVSYDAETEQVQFDARIHGVERSRRGLRVLRGSSLASAGRTWSPLCLPPPSCGVGLAVASLPSRGARVGSSG